MTNEELNAAVYEKMDAEQTEFIGWLLKLSPEEMLEHSFIVRCPRRMPPPAKILRHMQQ
jgi:hypothetical protein